MDVRQNGLQPPAGSAQSVIVGLDGGWRTRRLLRAAAEEARLRGLPLAVVSVLRDGADRPRPPWPGAHPATRDDEDAVRRRVDEAIEEVSSACPQVRVTGSCVRETDVDRGALPPAALLVVGARGWRRRLPFGLGTVSRLLLRTANSPVLVVPDDCPQPEDGPVTVLAAVEGGADGLVLRNAVEECERRGASLLLVHAYRTWPEETHEASLVRARDAVSACVRSAGVSLPRSTRVSLVEGAAAPAVLQRAAAEGTLGLVVVGTRGAAALAGLAFDSVSRAVLRDATCPVLVAPRPEAAVAATPVAATPVAATAVAATAVPRSG